MSQKETLKQFRKLLRKFNAMDNLMQVSTILTLVEVAIADEERRDMTTKDLEKALGVRSGTASRNTYYWADGHKAMSGAYGYMRVDVAATDRRLRSLSLTDRGKFFINNLTEDIDGETERKPVAS